MQKKTKKITRASRQNIGYAYIAIWIIGFLVFKFYPFMSSLFYSFTNYNLFKESVENIGFANYEKIVDTAKYLKSYIVTFKYAFMTVPLKLLFALFIAYLLNFKIKGINLFRTAYYIPSILGGSVAIAVLWQFLFQNEGLVNTIIGLFGVKPVNWLGSPDYALFVICLLRVWQFGSAMVIFLAALKGVPQDLYEAASIDGAGRWAKIKYVTLPGIKPTIMILLLMNVGNVLNAGFEIQYLLGNGLVQKVSQTIDIYVLKWGISQGDYSIGTAAGIFKSAVSIILIVIANQIAKRNGEERLF